MNKGMSEEGIGEGIGEGTGEGTGKGYVKLPCLGLSPRAYTSILLLELV